MLILTSWLKEFVPFTVSAEKLAADLTLAGLEAEGLSHLWQDETRVVAARIESVMRHPSSGRLHVCKVHAGRCGSFDVVCGAPNCREGILTILAMPGAVINGQEINVTEIAGVRSEGMLCSMAETGAGRDESGIADIGGRGLEPGDEVAGLPDFADHVIELGITPNRPDCLSIAGVAREVAALYDLRTLFSGDFYKAVDGKCPVPVRIENPELCRRYAGAVIKGVRVGPSPVWLRNRLVACGIRSVNNIVDITNYVMLELGQPMHAFDLSTLAGPEIVVRTSEAGKMRTLDGKECVLGPDMLTICDADGPVAVAGVMGGFDSQVTDSTTDIFLESACFTPSQVRRTAKRLKIPSESSYRFERGVDPELAPDALGRAVALVLEMAGGRFVGGVDVNAVPHEPLSITFPPDRANLLLGIDISPEEMRELLEKVGITVSSAGANAFECSVPSWRPDIHEYVDLVEEIARLHGFDRIPVRMPVAGIAGKPEDPVVYWAARSRDILSGAGMSEVISYSFLSEKDILAMKFPQGDRRASMVRLRNPLSEDQAVMRTTLAASLLGAVSRNIARRNLDLRFFEAGTVFHDNGAEKLPDEELRIAGVITGRRHPDSWAWPDDRVDFFDLKGMVEFFCDSLGLDGRYSFQVPQTPESWLAPDVSLELLLADGRSVGFLGLVANEVCMGFDIEQDVFAFDFSLERLAENASELRSFSPLNRFPAIELDLAVVVSDSVRGEDVVAFVMDNGPELLESCRIFDVYRGKPIDEGFRSLGLRFVYRSGERTLSEDDVASGHKALVERLLERFRAVLRS
jgi:phenylalanyl-tRNA synthetase beta chain